MSTRLALFFAFFAGTALAAGQRLSAADVDRALARYRKAGGVQADIKKIVVQEVMGTRTESEGRFFFSKGKLRMDLTKPEVATLVYDGKNVWLESRLDEQHVEVSRLKAVDLKRTDSLLAALFDKKDVLKNFKMLKAVRSGPENVYSFAPKEPKKTEVKSLDVALRGKDVARITYRDQMENQVSFEFSKLIKKSVPKEKFTYKPPKGANVSEI